MASMTVQAMRDYVRTSLGADEMEIPDSLIDVWRDEATSHIQTIFEPWHFYELSFAITTAASPVAFNSIGSGFFTLDTLRAVQGDTYTLAYLPHDGAVKKYAWGTWTGRPTEFSIDHDNLYLWPSPDTSYTYTVWGYRVPIAASAATDTVDLPTVFHPLISEWMLARGYEFEDDEIMSAQKFNRFEQQLAGLRKHYKRTSPAGVQQIGSLSDAPAIAERLIYDWEGRV